MFIISSFALFDISMHRKMHLVNHLFIQFLCPLNPFLAHLGLQPIPACTGRMAGHWAGRQSITGWTQIGRHPLTLTNHTYGQFRVSTLPDLHIFWMWEETREKPTQTCKLGTGRAKDQTWVLSLWGERVNPPLNYQTCEGCFHEHIKSKASFGHG